MKTKHPLWVLLGVLVLMVGLGSLTPTQAQGPDDPPHDLWDDVVDPVEGLELQNVPLVVSQISATDPDGDGLTTAQEIALGTDPNNADSDCDYKDDKTEVGNVASPTDTDGDGIIDALESSLADADGDKTNDEIDSDTTSPQLSCGRFIPFAIKLDNSESTRVEVKITAGTNITAVALTPAPDSSIFIKLDGTLLDQNTDIPLFDDGTHGDRIAGDGIWTRNQFTADYPSSSGATAKSEFSVLKVTDNGVQKTIDRRPVFQSSFAPITLFTIHAGDVQTPVMVNENLQTVSNLANIIDPLASLKVKQREYSIMASASQRFYQDFADAYDFLIFISDGPTVGPGVPYGEHFPVKNEVQNIGEILFNRTAAFGSAGKLRSVIFMNGQARTGPTIHEVMHTWGVSLSTDLGFQQCQGGHWGVSGVGKGQLGGFDSTTLVDNGDGTFTVDDFGPNANGGDSVPYVPLELYLAGLADAGAVSDIKNPINVDCNSLQFAGGTVTFKADGINTVTIAQIQTASGGARVPSSATSQKDFKAAMVIVSQYKLSGAEMSFFNQWSKIFGDDFDSLSTLSFKDATGNVGTMDTKMPVEKLVAVDKALVTTSVISPSAEITYTISITNGTGAALSNMTVSDNIPAKTNYVAGSATANPAIVTLTNFPATTPGFTLTNNSAVVITYRLKVIDTAQRGDILTNIATISAPTFMQPLTDSVSVTIGKIEVHLPLVIKN